MKLIPGKEVILFKLYMKKHSGIITVKDNKDRADKFEVDKAEVFLTGEDVKMVKTGDEVLLIPRPFMRLYLEKYLDETEDEYVWYSKGKEEDIVVVISN